MLCPVLSFMRWFSYLSLLAAWGGRLVRLLGTVVSFTAGCWSVLPKLSNSFSVRGWRQRATSMPFFGGKDGHLGDRQMRRWVWFKSYLDNSRKVSVGGASRFKFMHLKHFLKGLFMNLFCRLMGRNSNYFSRKILMSDLRSVSQICSRLVGLRLIRHFSILWCLCDLWLK